MRSLTSAFQTENVPPQQPGNQPRRSKAALRMAAHRWSRRQKQAMALLLIGSLAATLLFFAWAERSGRISLWSLQGQAGLEQRLADQGLYARNVNVSGLGFTTHEDIRTAIGAYDREALNRLAPADVRARLLDLPWVTHATVQRVWPQTLNIWIGEKQPLAVLHRSDGVFVVDQAGDAIVEADRGLITGYPNISGLGADESAPELFNALAAHPDLYGRFVGATRLSDRRWNLFLAPGIEVRLPAGRLTESLSVLADMDRFNQIFEKDVVALDLRGHRPVILR